MQEQIDAILRPFKREGYDTGAEFNGKFWEVWIGSHAGGRENGVSLAQDLAEKVRGMAVKAEPAPIPPQPLTAPLAAKPTPPATDYDAIIAGLKAQLAEALAKAPEPVEIPEFLKEEAPPVEIADLIRENEPHGEAQDRLLALYRSLGNKLVMGLASEAEGRLHSRLHGSLHWIGRGAVEVI